MKLYYNQVSSNLLNIKVDARTDVFNFGKDNAFPSLIEVLISISVTAKTCVDRVTKAIYAGTFGSKGDVIVNSKGQSLNEVLRIASREYAKHNNAYLQIGYDGNYDYNSINVIPTTDSRVGKADDKGYSGKFVIYDNWDKAKGQIKKESFVYVDRFSENKEIAKGQILELGKKNDVKLEAELLTQYNGQIIHIQKESVYVYSLPDLNPVLSEALLESNSQTFRMRGSTKGFLNTKLLAVQPFKDDPARKAFKKELNEFRGAGNSSDVVLLEASQVTDDLSKQISLQDLSSEYNDKLFEYSDSQAEKDICKAFTVPLILVNPSDSSLFGNSGAFLREAKLQLYESREEDRNQLEEVFAFIMKGFSEPIEDLEILNPFEEAVEEQEAVDANAQAQATLRGSVGGVTSLLAIQQSVGAGTTTKEAGVAMIVNIYGFSEEEAIAMLGDPEKKEGG